MSQHDDVIAEINRELRALREELERFYELRGRIEVLMEEIRKIKYALAYLNVGR